MRSPGRQLVVVFLLVAAIAALWPLASLARQPMSVLIVLLPALISGAVEHFGRSARIHPGIRRSVSAALFLLYVQFVILRSLSLGDWGRGMAQGLQRILSTTPPVIAPRWPLVPVVFFVWVAVAWVVALANAGRLGGAILVVFSSFSASFTLVIGGFDTSRGEFVWPALVAALTSALALVQGDAAELSPHEEGRTGLRTVVDRPLRMSALVCSAAAIGVFGASLYFGPTEKPFRPRLSPPADARVPDSPLLVVRKLRESGEEGRVMNLVSSPSRWIRLAALSQYNGRTWEVADRFQLTNGEISQVTNGQPASEISFRDVDLVATGGWVPFVGRPVSISSIDVLRPVGTGTVAFIVYG